MKKLFIAGLLILALIASGCTQSKEQSLEPLKDANEQMHSKFLETAAGLRAGVEEQTEGYCVEDIGRVMGEDIGWIEGKEQTAFQKNESAKNLEETWKISDEITAAIIILTEMIKVQAEAVVAFTEQAAEEIPEDCEQAYKARLKEAIEGYDAPCEGIDESQYGAVAERVKTQCLAYWEEYEQRH